MAIALRIEHVDGLRLRQQVAQSVARDDGIITGGAKWIFEKKDGTHDDAEVPRDLDPRTREPISTYSPTINFGLKNLVIERKGPSIHLQFRNSSIRNQLRIRYETLQSTGRTNKEGVDILEWKPSGAPQYLPAQQWGGVAVGDGTRAILDEMPT